MARTLSVKVPTALLIAQIEESIAKIDSDVANYAEASKVYKEALKQYEKDVVAHALKALSDPSNIGTEHDSLVRVEQTRYRNSSVSVEFDTEALGFPKKPEEPIRPNQKEYYGREYVTRKELLEKNLRILRMTSQEEVSASSYSSVIDLI
jgi:hypothetical protein